MAAIMQSDDTFFGEGGGASAVPPVAVPAASSLVPTGFVQVDQWSFPRHPDYKELLIKLGALTARALEYEFKDTPPNSKFDQVRIFNDIPPLTIASMFTLSNPSSVLPSMFNYNLFGSVII
ncbi:hypothetical protein HZB02_04625 [Candidatus Woesearchaeota archaeon]|nr:hypothetical protein [Candidatus Woesearchaeota archaeon]